MFKYDAKYFQLANFPVIFIFRLQQMMTDAVFWGRWQLFTFDFYHENT